METLSVGPSSSLTAELWLTINLLLTPLADYGNIALKMNVKMKGVNSILDPMSLGPIAEKPTVSRSASQRLYLDRLLGPTLISIAVSGPQMLFGADVSHPSPGSLAPSISAVVGTMDSKASMYGTAMRVQSCE